MEHPVYINFKKGTFFSGSSSNVSQNLSMSLAHSGLSMSLCHCQDHFFRSKKYVEFYLGIKEEQDTYTSLTHAKKIKIKNKIMVQIMALN